MPFVIIDHSHQIVQGHSIRINKQWKLCFVFGKDGFAAVPFLWTHQRLVAATSRRLRHAHCKGRPCQKAREDQTLIGAPGGEGIMSTVADIRVAAERGSAGSQNRFTISGR